jgi:hypothetical protein
MAPIIQVLSNVRVNLVPLFMYIPYAIFIKVGFYCSRERIEILTTALKFAGSKRSKTQLKRTEKR